MSCVTEVIKNNSFENKADTDTKTHHTVYIVKIQSVVAQG